MKMRTKSVSKTKQIFLFYVFSGGTMCFENLKAVENQKEELFLNHFNLYLTKWSGNSEKMTPIVFS